MSQTHNYINHWPSKLRLELWKRIDRHWQKGDIQITNNQFFRVMEQNFSRLAKVKASMHDSKNGRQKVSHFLGQRMPSSIPL